MIEYRHYVDQAIASTSTAIGSRIDDASLRAELETEFRETISARMESQERAARYAEMCPVEGAVPSDYHLREIGIFDDFSVLAGIHFRNLDTGYPFIGVFAGSRFLQPHEIMPATHLLAEEFGLFRPRSVQWWSPADRFDYREIAGAVGDQRLIVGCIPGILETPPPASTDHRLRLEPETEAEGYERYRDAFNEYLEANPEWRHRLPLTDREDFKECEDAGGLYRLMIDEEYAGVIAARPGQLKGIRGWEVMEELITAPFRGNGLAPVMQRLFIERLDTSKGMLILGTIDDRNLASMRTALRVGRDDIGGWVFLPTT